MSDALGYEGKQVGRIMSSDYALVKVDGGQVGLAQSVQAAYQHAVQPRFEAGSHHLYWVTGQSQGSMSVGRSVGTDFLGVEGLDKSASGALLAMSIQSTAGGEFGESFDGTGGSTKNLRFRGAVPQSINVTINAGGLDVSEGINIAVGLMEKS